MYGLISPVYHSDKSLPREQRMSHQAFFSFGWETDAVHPLGALLIDVQLQRFQHFKFIVPPGMIDSAITFQENHVSSRAL
jgi:hypothetical protein